MINIEYPSIVFIPWSEIKLKGFLNGSEFDPRHPIYWAEVPKEIPFSDWSPISVNSKNTEEKSLITDMVSTLFYNPYPLVVFGTDDILVDVIERLSNGDFEAPKSFEFMFYYTKELRFKKNCKFYFQETPFGKHLMSHPVRQPFLS
jgi:hypothetical protein